MGDAAVQYAPGQQLPGTVYRVVRHLATGGMGSVYDVEDVTVGKRYVLKTLHPQLVSRHDLAKRMEAEARTLAKLQHPNIVDVVTAGLTTDDKRMPFYVMERLNGQNLRVVIEKKGSLEITHCYRIAIDVLDALEQAHENSVIHRDVKPDNIFLHRNANGTTTTKLLDFGIMRLLDRKMSHTQGKFIGTLRYASPEQIYGGDLGPATDIYSLGVVLYEMICGRGPFDEIGDAFAIGAAHAQRPAPPVSQFAPSVPPELERLVMSALAKAPQERPRDCFSFAGELRRMLRNEEAAPKSVTSVNVLSSGPPNTAAVLPRAEPPFVQGVAAVGRAEGPNLAPTDLGMTPPSVVASGGAALPPTIRYEPGRPAAGNAVGYVVGGGGASDMAVAATLASSPGGDEGRAAAAAAVAAVAAADARAAARGSVPGARPEIDRSAETRASSGAGFTQRLSPNGTAVDLGGALPDTGDAVRAALAQREPLEVPPTSGHLPDARNHEIVFPATHGYVGGTGPLAGEARTRPPERSMLLPLLGAAAFGALLVGGAVLLVTKPWTKTASASASAITVTAPPSAVTAPPPPATEPPPVVAPSTAPVARAPVVVASASVATTTSAPRADAPAASPAGHATSARTTPASTPARTAGLPPGQPAPAPLPPPGAPRKPSKDVPAPAPSQIGF